jgi:hypothetical protein
MVPQTLSAFFVCLVSVLAQPALPRLELGKPIANALRAGEVQWIALEAPTGSFLRGSVRQEGIGIRVRGFFPDGSKIRSFAGPNTGVKDFRFVIEMPGLYQLELTGDADGSPEGRYTTRSSLSRSNQSRNVAISRYLTHGLARRFNL